MQTMGNDEAMLGVATLECRQGSVEVNGVAYDSRRVQPGNVFVAMRGGATDGNRFIGDAIGRGAAAVVTDSREIWDQARTARPAIGFYLVENGRRALSGISANIFRHPEQRLALTAVTGTNGKTTTSYLLESILRSVRRTCVLVGTIESHVGDEVRASPHTTPESRDLFELFSDGLKAGATEAVMEMSSHALEQERVWGLPVDVAVFTNLTQDHLDYHGTMENYLAAKAKLFEGVGTVPPRVAVINRDDAVGARLAEIARHSQVVTYGMGQYGEFCAEQVRMVAGETQFRMLTPEGAVEMRSQLTGRVNIYNLLAASAAAHARGLSLAQIVAGTAAGTQVPGRFQMVPAGESGLTVVVDYAHTEDALRNLIALARELVAERGGKVITLFGCGGDRDRTKRPRMGKAAGEGSDLVVLTSDNPRSESPMVIIEETLAGIEATGATCIVEEDRAGAIEIAIRAAGARDIVLIAGKGHEKIQILRDETIPFDDAAVAAAILEEIAK